jgi:hypothetical protein
MTNSTIVSEKVLNILTNSNTSYNDLEELGFEQDVLLEIQDWKEEGFTDKEISKKIILYVNVMELNTIAMKVTLS